MNRSKKKSFDWYGVRQRFSIRKYHIGAASVLLGTTLVLGTGTIVGAETGVNGDGASNGQIVPGNGTGTSDGTTSTTQQHSDNQGNNSSGVQTGNTTNSTANVLPADDTGSASSQPVGTSRSANTGTQGDGTTNPTVDEPIIKFPTTVNDPVPEGYVLVAFIKPESGAKYVFEGLPGEFPNAPAQLIELRKLQLEVRFWVKKGTTWGQLFETPEWRWPKINPVSGDVFIDWNYGYGNSNRFDSNKMKDQLVTTSYFIPMLNYEVEEIEPSNASVEAFLAWYSPEGRSKWFIVSFDAGQGSMTYKSKQYTSRSVAVYYQNIGYDNNQFTSKVVSPTLDGHTFVRWQTEDGKVLPTTGTIAKNETYTALYLTHPAEKTAVFNEQQLTATEKERLIQAIYDANPNSTGLIESITVSETGAATVIYNDGTTVIVQATDLITEDKDTARSLAKADIERAAIEKKDEINASNFTDEEKAEKIKEVEAAQNTANNAIDAAATTDELEKALTEGKATIEGIDTTTSAKKADAKKNLEDVYNAKKDAITNSGLTAEEKATKQAELDKAKADAEKAIDAATDNAGVDTALNKGKADIAAIDTSASPKKAAAKQDLEEAYNAKKDAITNSGLTAEEKATKQAELDKAKETAENAIDTATDDAGVDTALNKGKADIAAFDTSASPKKATAKQDLEEAYNAKKAEIENSVLTAEEKATKQAALDKAKADAEKAIDAATDNAGVDTALAAGKTAIAAIDTTASTAKADAKKNLEEAYNAKKDAITNSGLTAEEKATKQAELDKAKADVDKAIDTATDNAGVAKALEDGKAAIDAIDTSTSAKKAQAKEELKAVADDAKKAIDANDNLTDAEKQAAKDAVDAEVAKAEKTIDAATKADEVDAATLAGTKAIAADVLDAAKQDAKNKIAKDLATVEAAIDANSNLSQDEKDAAKLAAQAKEAEAVANIEKATTPEAAQTLEDAAVKDLANIEIKAAYDDAVKAIEAADNLSTAAKTQALEDLKKARQAAEDAIKTAATADEVAKGALDGLKSIAKVEAKAAADDAKAAIAQNSNLTDAEKKVYTDAIDEALKDTETKIDAATDADTVDAETVLAQKDIAKQEVAAATADAVKGIEANTNLTDAEKDEYKATVTKAAETAEQAITDATTAADIQSKTFDATQDVAKEEVKADAADAIAGIKANDNLSDTAKEEAIAAIEEARNTTLENIENAKTAKEVDTATLDAEKANAKAEIKAAADDAKKAIDENANLPASDKNALKLAIDAEVAATNLEIDNAKTAEEIDAATLATEKSIAKAEVKAAAEDALQAIDENANLTDDEKAKAKADVYVELSKAEKAINKATTADAIDNATLVGEKAFATAELEAAADDAKKAIDANTHLTDDQKQAAKDAVDAELAKAKEAVVAAKTADEVDAATLVGEKAIAKEEIKAAAEDAKKAIDANSNLT
ncbi:TPA: DUF1542 domain-containing protein, partial [Streptococcus suis]|nr:DUF1542 domain-containing protein [Streptococcus suis]